jgi:hypothetical protein
MRINKELLLGGTVLAIGLFFVAESYQLPPGDHFLNSSRSFPMLLGYCLMILSIWQLIQAIREKTKSENIRPSMNAIKRGGAFIFLTVLYIFVFIPIIGFLSSTWMFLLVGMMLFKEVRWYIATAVSVGMVGFIYVVFEKLMYIRFP